MRPKKGLKNGNFTVNQFANVCVGHALISGDNKGSIQNSETASNNEHGSFKNQTNTILMMQQC